MITFDDSFKLNWILVDVENGLGEIVTSNDWSLATEGVGTAPGTKMIWCIPISPSSFKM